MPTLDPALGHLPQISEVPVSGQGQPHDRVERRIEPQDPRQIGFARKLDQAELLILSSRISYELVQKSARARIPIILAHSRPTALAVNLADNLNMTVASFDDNDAGLYVFCGEKRLVS